MRSNLQGERATFNSQRNLSAKGEGKTTYTGFSPISSSKLAQNKRASSDYFTFRKSANKTSIKPSSSMKSAGSYDNIDKIYSSPSNKNNESQLTDSVKKGNSSLVKKKNNKSISHKKTNPPVNSFMNSLGLNSDNLTINRIPMSPIGFKTLSENLNLLNTRCNTDNEKLKYATLNLSTMSIASPTYAEKKKHQMSASTSHNSMSIDPVVTLLTNENNQDGYSIKNIKSESDIDTQRKLKIGGSGEGSEKFGAKHTNLQETLVSPKNHQPKIVSRHAKEPKKDENKSMSVDSVLSRFNFINPKTIFQNIFSFGSKKRVKCQCDPNLHEDQSCSKAIKWMSKKYKPSEHDYLKDMYEKLLADDSLIDIEYVRQIKKDINRTFPDSKYFCEGSEGVKVLERILNVFAKYDPKIGYVQGMNFIAGSLLFHAEEYQAFWLLVMIFEMFEMRDIYLPKLPGLTKHCQMIDMLIFNYHRKLYSHFCENNIKVEMFCSEWIFALFASVIPVENMAIFYDSLLEYGWPFFYKVILGFLQQFENALLEKDDLADILSVLKSQNHITKFSTKNKNEFAINWKELFGKTEKMEIDTFFIYKMHSSFDVQNQWYKTSYLEK